MFKNKGFCHCCDQKTVFKSSNDWLRDHYVCTKCGSLPRERAIMKVIEMYYPNWRDLSIHESSPSMRGASLKLKKECKNYISSHYWPQKPPGSKVGGIVNLNLENQSFENNSFDLVITQDVFEHIYKPDEAANEIARTLKNGGSHICTIPMVNKEKPTEPWSIIDNDEVKFLKDPEYHGNPIDPNGSPVSFHYGYDLGFLLQKWSGLFTTIVHIDNLSLGIRAEFIEVIISRKC